MSIYTKTGDKGTTSLFGGKRVSKTDLQIEAYGTVDELTSFIGLLITKVKARGEKEFLIETQKSLYEIMGVLAGSEHHIVDLEPMIKKIEQEIDFLESRLSKLNRFILPGGTENAALSHLARVITRRAERAVVSFYSNSQINKNQEKYRIIIFQYLNRLSDYFFIYARKLSEGKEITT